MRTFVCTSAILLVAIQLFRHSLLHPVFWDGFYAVVVLSPAVIVRKIFQNQGLSMFTEELTRKLVEMLKKVDPNKIILFGSYAYGQPNPGGDVDILVVTEDDFLPKDFAEKNAILEYLIRLPILRREYRLI